MRGGESERRNANIIHKLSSSHHQCIFVVYGGSRGHHSTQIPCRNTDALGVDAPPPGAVPSSNAADTAPVPYAGSYRSSSVSPDTQRRSSTPSGSGRTAGGRTLFRRSHWHIRMTDNILIEVPTPPTWTRCPPPCPEIPPRRGGRRPCAGPSRGSSAPPGTWCCSTAPSGSGRSAGRRA